MKNQKEINQAIMKGTVTEDLNVSHESYGSTFYKTNLSVLRHSGVKDIVPVVIHGRHLTSTLLLRKGTEVVIEGQIRTRDDYVDGRTRLKIFLFAKKIQKTEEYENINGILLDNNQITLTGSLCKEAIFRKTPAGKEISDMLIASDRGYANQNSKSKDYIPTIAWGNQAIFSTMLGIDEDIYMEGRLQSRDYEKKDSMGEIETRTAYELSLSKISRVGDIDK